jgi:hypothetical protein
MTFEVVFQPEAKSEFFEAVNWYENQLPGLGKEFAKEVFSAVERAQIQPDMFLQVRGGARRIPLKRFKAYRIYFAIIGNVISVISIFHGARNPAELRHRLK